LIVTADDFGLAPEVNEAVESRASARHPHRGEPHGRGPRGAGRNRARGGCRDCALAALTAPAMIAVARRPDLALGGYSDF
jgi:hypothetical protein